MKKLITLFVLLGMAVSAQAGAVNWICSGAVESPDSKGDYNGSKVEGVVAYLFNVADISLSEVVTAIEDGQFSTVVGDALESRYTVLGNITAGNVQGGALTYPNSSHQEFFMVVFNTDDYTTATWYTTGEKDGNMAAGGQTLTLNFNAAAMAGSWSVIPIPEPATMALLGIGVVALGLRRRRK